MLRPGSHFGPRVTDDDGEVREMERKWWTLVAVCVAIFMLLMDVTIVNVALPSIESSLGASFSELQWVIDAYALTLAALLLTSGSIADLVGRRKVFSTGLVLFTLASVGCGLAQDPLMLIISRGVQGIGGAIMFATSLAILSVAFTGRERGTAFGIWGATTGLAVAIGPTLGGALSESSWRWIFLVNVPIGIAALVVTSAKVDESKSKFGGKVDFPGVVTFTTALFALILALIEGNDWGWGSGRIVALLVGAVVLLAAFVVVERRSSHAMFDLALLRNPSFLGAAIVAFTLSGALFSQFLYLTLYLQNVLGASPLEAGLYFLPLSVTSFFAAAIAGRLSQQLPARMFLGVGMLLIAIGLFLFAGIDPGDSWKALIPGLLAAGIGVGMVNPPLGNTAVAVVQPHRSGMASGSNSTFRQVGIATGIAALGAVFQHRVHQGIIDNLKGTPAAKFADKVADGAQSGGGGGTAAKHAPAAVQKAIEHAVHGAFIDGLNDILLIAAAVALVGSLAGFLLVRGKDFVGHTPVDAAKDAIAAVRGD